MLSAVETSQLEVDRAAGQGHVEVLDPLWQSSKGAVHPSPAGLQMAAAAGKVTTLEWAHVREVQGFDGLMDIAAWKGRLSVLKWLHANRPEGGTANANKWAAQSGHLKVLRWLLDTLGQQCTGEALEAAAIAGHARVVAWILRHSGQDQVIGTTPAVVAAASNGHVDVLKLLLSAPQTEKSGWAVALASDGGHVDCVKLLLEARWPSDNDLAGSAAIGRTSMEEGSHDRHGEEGEGPLRDGPYPQRDEGVRAGSRTEEETRELIGQDKEACHHLPHKTARKAAKDRGLHDEDDEGVNIADPARVPTERNHKRRSLSPGKGARSCTQERSRGVHRVLSLDVELPRTDSAGNMPPSSLKPPASRGFPTPQRPPSSASSLDLGGEPPESRHTASNCIYAERTNADPAAERRSQRCGDTARDAELLARGAGRGRGEKSGVADGDGRGDRDDESRLQKAFFEATRTLALGEANRVRDVWTPLSHAPLSGARLNLGVLAESSRDPVISAYIEGLLQDRKDTTDARRMHHFTLETATTPLGGKRESGLHAPKTPTPSGSSRLLALHPVMGRKALPSALLPSPPETPSVAHASATARVAPCASANAAHVANCPGHFPSPKCGRPQHQRTQRTISGHCSPRSFTAPASAGCPAPPAATRPHLARAATAPACTPGSDVTTSEGEILRRDGTAPEHPALIEKRAYIRSYRGRQIGDRNHRWRERGDLYGGGLSGSADGSCVMGGNIRHGRGDGGNTYGTSGGSSGSQGGFDEGFDASGASCRHRPSRTCSTSHVRQGWSLSYPERTNDAAFLVCRGWGKPPASSPPASPDRPRDGSIYLRAEIGTSATRTPALSPRVSEAPSFNENIGRGYLHELEVVPRGMFLTRQHRCGGGMAPPA